MINPDLNKNKEFLNNSYFKDFKNYLKISLIKEDDFNDLLLFNTDINKKSIFKENNDIFIINNNKDYNINSLNKSNKINKIKIEIKDLIELNNYKEVINNINKDD